MSHKKGLNDAYSLKTPEDSVNLYKVWASSYDSDFAEKNDYRSPFEIAGYFDKYANQKDMPILDVGAGTGLVAECLRSEYQRDIHAIDISPEMLDLARIKNCYSKLIEADLTEDLQIDNEVYGGVVSAGTFTHGHVGPDALDELLRVTKPNGLFVITIHSKLFKKAGFENKFNEIKNKISEPIVHEVKAYGNNPDKEHGNDVVLVMIFRKNKP